MCAAASTPTSWSNTARRAGSPRPRSNCLSTTPRRACWAETARTMPELPPATPLEGVLTYLVVGGVLAIAALFKPWQVLRHPPLQNPWGVALLILPFVWWTERLLPAGMDGMALHLSGACLLVLMFGWPLAMWTLLPVAVGAQLIDNAAPPDLTVL